jgi:hypothetical protein
MKSILSQLFFVFFTVSFTLSPLSWATRSKIQWTYLNTSLNDRPRYDLEAMRPALLKYIEVTMTPDQLSDRENKFRNPSGFQDLETYIEKQDPKPAQEAKEPDLSLLKGIFQGWLTAKSIQAKIEAEKNEKSESERLDTDFRQVSQFLGLRVEAAFKSFKPDFKIYLETVQKEIKKLNDQMLAFCTAINGKTACEEAVGIRKAQAQNDNPDTSDDGGFRAKVAREHKEYDASSKKRERRYVPTLSKFLVNNKSLRTVMTEIKNEIESFFVKRIISERKIDNELSLAIEDYVIERHVKFVLVPFGDFIDQLNSYLPVEKRENRDLAQFFIVSPLGTVFKNIDPTYKPLVKGYLDESFQESIARQVGNSKAYKSANAYALSLKYLTASTLVSQINYHRNFILGERSSIRIPKGCQVGEFRDKNGSYTPEFLDPKDRRNGIDSLLTNMGISLDIGRAPYAKDKYEKVPMRNILNIDIQFGRKGIKSAYPYGFVPFDRYRAAERYTDREDTRFEPALDNKLDFEFALTSISEKFATKLQARKDKFFTQGDVFSKLIKNYAAVDFCVKDGKRENCNEKEIPAFRLEHWSQYLYDVVFKDHYKDRDVQSIPKPSTFMCNGGVELMRSMEFALPSPKLYGDYGYRTWALQVLLKNYSAFLNGDKKYTYLKTILQKNKICSKKLPEGCSGNDPVPSIKKLFEIVSGEAFSNFVPLYDDSSVVELRKYPEALQVLWISLAEFFTSLRETARTAQNENSKKNIETFIKESDVINTNEWDYASTVFASQSSAWVNYKLAYIYASVCDRELSEFVSNHPEQRGFLNYLGQEFKFTDGQPCKSNDTFLTKLKESELFKGLPETTLNQYCRVNKVPVHPYYGNRVLNQNEKLKLFSEIKKTSLDFGEFAEKTSDDIVESLEGASKNSYGLKNSMNEFEDIFKYPLILTDEDFSQAAVRLKLQGALNDMEIRESLEEIKKDQSAKKSFKTAKFYKTLYTTPADSRPEKLKQLLAEEKKQYLESTQDSETDQKTKLASIESTGAGTVRGDFVVVDMIYKKALYLTVLKQSSRQAVAKTEKALDILCGFDPTRDIENFKRIVITTTEAQKVLNKSWGIETPPTTVMDIVAEGDMAAYFGKMGLFIAGYVAATVLTATCMGVTGGLGTFFCQPVFFWAAAGVLTLGQVLMTSHEILSYQELSQYRELNETFETLGVTEKEILDSLPNTGEIGVTIEVVTALPVIGVLQKLPRYLLTSLSLGANAARTSQYSSRIAKFGRGAIGALTDTRFYRLAEVGIGLRKLGMLTYLESTSMPKITEMLDSLTEEVINKKFGEFAARQFANNPKNLKSLLRDYTDPRVIDDAASVLADDEAGKLSLKRRAISLGGLPVIRNFMFKRANKKIVMSAEVREFLEKLESVRPENFAEFLGENAITFYTLIDTVPYRARDMFFEGLFQGPGMASILQGGGLLNANYFWRLSPVQGMVDFSILRGMSRSMAHISIELRRLKAQRLFNLPKQIMEASSSFEIKEGLRVTSSVVREGLLQQGKTDALIDFALNQQRHFDEVSRSAMGFWKARVTSTEPVTENARVVEFLKTNIFKENDDDTLKAFKELFYGDASQFNVNNFDGEIMGRAVWNLTGDQVLYRNISRPALETSADLAMRHLGSIDNLDQWSTFESIIETLRFKGKLEGTQM